MTTLPDFKQIERQAFRSVHKDGLWDMYYGFVLIAIAGFLYRPAEGYTALNPVLAILTVTLIHGLLSWGKRNITVPRMGQVEFGAARKRRLQRFSWALAGLVLLQVIVVAITINGWTRASLGASLENWLQDARTERLAVASIGALIAGSGMVLLAYARDFARGFYIAGLMMLAVFTMIYLNQPIYPILLGSLIAIPGAVMFIRFLREYPLPRDEAQGD